MARSARLESGFQDHLRDRLKEIFPGCFVFKMTALQGWPDLLILWHDRWAALECKKSAHEAHQPNQDYYVEVADEMSFARFIYPENEEEVLHDLEQSFQV